MQMKGKIFEWGLEKTSLQLDKPNVLHFRGMKLEKWPELTVFFDADTSFTYVVTEINAGGYPPLRLNLKTRKSVEPGKYYLEFCFSYYYGQKWKTSTRRVEFTIRSLLERNQALITWWGLTISAASAVLLVGNILKLFNIVT